MGSSVVVVLFSRSVVTLLSSRITMQEINESGKNSTSLSMLIHRVWLW